MKNPATRKSYRPAMLPCVACEAWTRHTFAHIVSAPDLPVGEMGEVYRCGCGEERRWGVIGRIPASLRHRIREASPAALLAE